MTVVDPQFREDVLAGLSAPIPAIPARWLYDRRDLTEAKADLAAWLSKWSARYPRLTTWAEENIDCTLDLLPPAAPAPSI